MRTNLNIKMIARIISALSIAAILIFSALKAMPAVVDIHAFSKSGNWSSFQFDTTGKRITASCSGAQEICKATLHFDKTPASSVAITLNHQGLSRLSANMVAAGETAPLISQHIDVLHATEQQSTFIFDLPNCTAPCQLGIEIIASAENTLSLSATLMTKGSALPFVLLLLMICLWGLTEAAMIWQKPANFAAFRAWIQNSRVKSAMLPNPQKDLIDPLTDALNRKGFEQQAASVIESHPGQAALCVIDLDRFKYINDAYGRAAGDELLAAFSSRIKKAIRASDCLARWGGEEFVILSLQPSERSASKFAAKLCAVAANEPFQVKGSPELQITVSIGLAQHDPKESFNSWFLRADAALFHAKQSGKNRVCIAPSEREA